MKKKCEYLARVSWSWSWSWVKVVEVEVVCRIPQVVVVVVVWWCGGAVYTVLSCTMIAARGTSPASSSVWPLLAMSVLGCAVNKEKSCPTFSCTST